jgi:hypothetical protein
MRSWFSKAGEYAEYMWAEKRHATLTRIPRKADRQRKFGFGIIPSVIVLSHRSVYVRTLVGRIQEYSVRNHSRTILESIAKRDVDSKECSEVQR